MVLSMPSSKQSWLSLANKGHVSSRGVKELYALSTEKRIVYIRFWTKRAKYNAEAKFKAFKSSNPGCQFIVARPNQEKFPSDVRQSREEIRSHLYKLYVNSLKFNGLGQNEPSYMRPSREQFSWTKSTSGKRARSKCG